MGAPVLIRKAMGADASDEQIDYALTYFMSWYRDHMLEHTRPYPGVMEGLELVPAGRPQDGRPDNKPERFSKTLLAGPGYGQVFLSGLWRQQLSRKEA